MALAADKRWELYRTLGEPVRLRLLRLVREEELTIGELAELLDESQPNVSRHVGALKRSDVLDVRRHGTRTLVRLASGAAADAVVGDALGAGEVLCAADGSLARVAEVVRARDQVGREFFAKSKSNEDEERFPSELPAYLTALATLVPRRSLAFDVGTGDGRLLEVLAPVFERVVGIDREGAQLERARARLASRGYDHVDLIEGDVADPGFRDAVSTLGQGDAVFASRILHHAPRPHSAVGALAALLAPGGVLVVLDYAAHEDERMRDQQADLWLGFEPDELRAFARDANLERASVVRVPASRSGKGPDAHLDWTILTAARPS